MGLQFAPTPHQVTLPILASLLFKLPRRLSTPPPADVWKIFRARVHLHASDMTRAFTRSRNVVLHMFVSSFTEVCRL